MKIKELLTEGVTFAPAKLTSDQRGVKYWQPAEQRVTVKCKYCDGTGHPEYPQYALDDGTCEVCQGKGQYEEWQYLSPTLEVANHSAGIILDMLETPRDELMGAWQFEELPQLKRQLIKLKNTNTDRWQEPESQTTGATRIDRSGDHSRITGGPTIYSQGYDQERINRYIDAMLEIVEWAQKNNMGVSYA